MLKVCERCCNCELLRSQKVCAGLGWYVPKAGGSCVRRMADDTTAAETDQPGTVTKPLMPVPCR